MTIKSSRTTKTIHCIIYNASQSRVTIPLSLILFLLLLATLPGIVYIVGWDLPPVVDPVTLLVIAGPILNKICK